MKIGVYGCSFTYGAYPLWISWVKKASELYPQHDWYNHSFSGISNNTILYMFEHFKHNYDINIVKLTSSSRVTFIDPDWQFEHSLRQPDGNNYWVFDREEVRNKLIRITPSSISLWETDKNYKRWEDYQRLTYENFNNKQYMLEYNIISDYMKQNAQLVYAHKDYAGPRTTGVVKPLDWTIHDKLGSIVFDSYVIDEGLHFNEQGAEHEATLVYNKIKAYIK